MCVADVVEVHVLAAESLPTSRIAVRKSLVVSKEELTLLRFISRCGDGLALPSCSSRYLETSCFIC